MNFLHPQTAVSVYNEVKKKFRMCSKQSASNFFPILSPVCHYTTAAFLSIGLTGQIMKLVVIAL